MSKKAQFKYISFAPGLLDYSRSETGVFQSRSCNQSNSDSGSVGWKSFALSGWSDCDPLRIEQLCLQRPCSNPKSFIWLDLLKTPEQTLHASSSVSWMMLSDTNGVCWEALLNVAANTADWKISQCFDTRALFQYWVVNDYSCSTRLMWILPDTGHSDTTHLQERAALTGETSALRATNRDSCGTRPHEELQHVLLCRRTALPLPSVLCWGSGRYCGCSGRPARSLRWSQPPRWPLSRPVSSSPAPPVESKSWADRAVRLSFQRSAEKRAAAETLRASLWDQLQETNTTHSQTHRKLKNTSYISIKPHKRSETY